MDNLVDIIKKAIHKECVYNSKTNYLLELKKGGTINKTLEAQVISIKNELENLNNLSIPQKKRRRRAQDISKQFKCSHCEKIYASEASLNLHSKIKHIISESETKSNHL
ncbi:hypothetical protein pb186bvf_019280 [Paramecium bursaria]